MTACEPAPRRWAWAGWVPWLCLVLALPAAAARAASDTVPSALPAPKIEVPSDMPSFGLAREAATGTVAMIDRLRVLGEFA